MALKVINVPFCNFKKCTQRNLKRDTNSESPIAHLTINAYIKFNYRWCVNSGDLHVVPGVVIVYSTT